MFGSKMSMLWRIGVALRRPALLGLAGAAAWSLSSEAAQSRAAASAHASSPALSFLPDAYNGVIVEQAALADFTDAPKFGEALRQSCERWSEDGMRGVWLHFPLDHSEKIPEAVKHGFKFHHADEKVLTMVRWLPKCPSTLPPGPSHQIGVGAFVMNSDGAVLLVKERTGPAAKYGVWKVPTGLIEPGEDLFDAVRREVLEETGVHTSGDDARILSIRSATACSQDVRPAALTPGCDDSCLTPLHAPCSQKLHRHAHPAHAGGVSDLFVMIELKLDSTRDDADKLSIQESEIAEAKWMPFAELAALTYYKPGSMLYEMVLAATAEKQTGFSGRTVANGSRPGGAQVYRARL